jgi:hypothetical protein
MRLSIALTIASRLPFTERPLQKNTAPSPCPRRWSFTLTPSGLAEEYNPIMENVIDAMKKRVEEQREDIINFLRDIVAIPSMDGQLKEVGERIGAEMKRLKFDEVRATEWYALLPKQIG